MLNHDESVLKLVRHPVDSAIDKLGLDDFRATCVDGFGTERHLADQI